MRDRDATEFSPATPWMTSCSLPGQQQGSMLVNGLRNANHVEVGQTLKLPRAVTPMEAETGSINVGQGPANAIERGQTLTQIARAYELPVATLIDINAISNPNKVTVGTRLYLKAPEQPKVKAEPVATAEPKPQVKPQPQPTSTSTQARINSKPKAQPQAATVVAKGADWRTYGPLQVDWANWQPMGGSQVVPSLNAEGQALYLAVNCDAEKLNVTGADGSWKTWASPKSSFEKALVKDRCQARA